MTQDDLTQQEARVEVLGIGSARNRELLDNLEAALDQMNLRIPYRQVEDISRLLQYDISGIPALVIDGRVVFQQVVPSVEDLRIALSVMIGNGEVTFPMKRILVPTDFSEAADGALAYAMALAENYDSTVRLVHVHKPSSGPLTGMGMWSAGDPAMDLKKDWIRARAQQYDGRPAWLPGQPEDRIRVAGNVAEEIKELSKRSNVDLIVMGATGEHSLPEKWMGTVSSSVARHAFCPVLLVPEGTAYRPMRKIIYASEFQQGEEVIWPRIGRLAARLQASIHFVHVQENELNGYLVERSHAGYLPREERTRFRVSTVQCQDVLEGLNKYAEEQDADLMVVANLRRSGVNNWFHSSLTKRMIYKSKLPMLVMHFKR